MAKRNVVEVVVGAVVLSVAVGFVFFAYKTGKIDTTNGYTLTAKFDRVDGLNVGSDVRVSGLKVGNVTALNIDPQTYQAVASLTIDEKIKIPSDSAAEIISDGLLGSKFIGIVPGGEDQILKDKDEITYTQSSVSIESLIGKFMFNGEDKKKKEAEKTEDSQELSQ